MIWFGWISNCYASSARVLSLFATASATCALNLGEWFRRFLPVMFLHPFMTVYAVSCESKAIAYPSVQYSGTTLVPW